MPRTPNRAALFGAAALASATADAQPLYPGGNYPYAPRGAPYPDVIYPENETVFPDGFVITRTLRGGRGKARMSPDPAAINLPRDLPDKLSACWTPPAVPEGQVWQVTVRLSFRADGAVIGEPATPYLQAPSADDKRALRASLLAGIRACTPLRFTPSLGRAIAGRIFAIRFLVRHATYDRRT